jgi:hypothetical protein
MRATMTADDWNARYPVGTPVFAWPGVREDDPLVTKTRTAAWTLGHGAAVVSVDGCAGGIALTHVDVRGTLEEELNRIARSATRLHDMPPGYRLVWEADA